MRIPPHFPAPTNSSAKPAEGESAVSSKKNLSIEGLRAELPLHSVTVIDPHIRQEVSYQGFNFPEVLNKMYGPAWKDAYQIAFTCADGYWRSISVEKLKEFPSFLAVARTDGAEFSVDNPSRNLKSVPLAPGYLTWESKTFPKLADEKRMGDWPYQVVALETVQEGQYRKISPPETSSKAAKEGYNQFRENCLACHQIGGFGGTAGVDLTKSAHWSGTKDHLIQQMLKPTGTMPPLTGADKEKVAQEIAAYLEVMAGSRSEFKED